MYPAMIMQVICYILRSMKPLQVWTGAQLIDMRLNVKGLDCASVYGSLRKTLKVWKRLLIRRVKKAEETSLLQTATGEKKQLISGKWKVDLFGMKICKCLAVVRRVGIDLLRNVEGKIFFFARKKHQMIWLIF